MHYKTIVLELLQQRPQLLEQLRKHRNLLWATEHYARELKSTHRVWKEFLIDLRPGSDKNQIASEALEMALKELEDRLPTDSQDDVSLFLDAAMLFLRRRPTSRE